MHTEKILRNFSVLPLGKSCCKLLLRQWEDRYCKPPHESRIVHTLHRDHRSAGFLCFDGLFIIQIAVYLCIIIRTAPFDPLVFHRIRTHNCTEIQHLTDIKCFLLLVKSKQLNRIIAENIIAVLKAHISICCSCCNNGMSGRQKMQRSIRIHRNTFRIFRCVCHSQILLIDRSNALGCSCFTLDNLLFKIKITRIIMINLKIHNFSNHLPGGKAYRTAF